MIEPWVAVLVAMVLLLPAVRYMGTKPAPRRADYRKIHALEYELGMRDDPPPRNWKPSYADVLKDVYTHVPTDEPGSVIYYDPDQAPPQWSYIPEPPWVARAREVNGQLQQGRRERRIL